ncbi:MAG: BolA family transcriptional regulator [Xanthomonadales bacterium]|nr:BolA family transcriptional regulator [Xanthomonadales bacterium]
MSDSANRRPALIESILREHFAPSELQVIDEGHLHVGHAGARDGRGHFRVIMVSEGFVGLAPLARHRAVYAALGSLMESDIHALALSLKAPNEV